MALEIQFESAEAVAESDLIDFFAWQSSGELVNLDGNPFLRTPAMDISPYIVEAGDSEEEERHAALVGFRRRVLVVFRLRVPAGESEQAEGYAMMLNAILTFVRNHPGEAALIYNGEEIIMRCRDKEVVFDTWEGFDEEPALAAIVAGYPQRTLEQPLL